MSRLSFITAILFAISAAGATQAQLAPIKNVQQECMTLGCIRYSSYGSAVAVAHSRGGTVFLSAAHNLDPKSDTSKMVSLEINGEPVKVIGKWKDNKATDLALLYLPGRLYTLVSISSEPLKVGEDVVAGGFDFAQVSGQPRGSGKPVVRYYETKVLKVTKNEFGDTDRSWPVGMSGGSLIRPGGGLVGVISHSSGFNVNWNLQAFVASHFPDAEFGEAPPPPKLTGDEKPALKLLPDAVPPPRDIPARQDDGSKEAGKEAPVAKVPEIKDVQPQLTAEQVQALIDASKGEKVDEASLIDRIVKNPELLDRVKQAAGAAAAVTGTAAETAADSGWFETGVKVAATAAFGPAGAVGSTVALGVGGWLWNRRQKRKADEAAELVRYKAQQDAVNKREAEQKEARRKKAEQAAIDAVKQREVERDQTTTQAAAELAAKSAHPMAEALRKAGQLVGGAGQQVGATTEPEATQQAAADKTAELQKQIDGLVQYIKDREAAEPEEKPGLTAEQVIGDDGQPALAYFQDGVRLLKDNRLPVKVLGHRQAAGAIESYVYERVANDRGTHLNQNQNRSGS